MHFSLDSAPKSGHNVLQPLYDSSRSYGEFDLGARSHVLKSLKNLGLSRRHVLKSWKTLGLLPPPCTLPTVQACSRCRVRMGFLVFVGTEVGAFFRNRFQACFWISVGFVFARTLAGSLDD